jgi:hypothetical protein
VDGHGVRLHDDGDDGHVLAQLSHVAAAGQQQNDGRQMSEVRRIDEQLSHVAAEGQRTHSERQMSGVLMCTAEFAVCYGAAHWGRESVHATYECKADGMLIWCTAAHACRNTQALNTSRKTYHQTDNSSQTHMYVHMDTSVEAHCCPLPHIVLAEPVWWQAVQAHVHARVLHIDKVDAPAGCSSSSSSSKRQDQRATEQQKIRSVCNRAAKDKISAHTRCT